MPRVETVRVLKVLWVAWRTNDYGVRGPIRYGWSENHARTRAAFAPDEVNEVVYCVDEGHWTGYECPPDCPGVWPAGMRAPDEVNGGK
jgi:hypothetical protein